MSYYVCLGSGIHKWICWCPIAFFLKFLVFFLRFWKVQLSAVLWNLKKKTSNTESVSVWRICGFICEQYKACELVSQDCWNKCLFKIVYKFFCSVKRYLANSSLKPSATNGYYNCMNFAVMSTTALTMQHNITAANRQVTNKFKLWQKNLIFFSFFFWFMFSIGTWFSVYDESMY